MKRFLFFLLFTGWLGSCTHRQHAGQTISAPAFAEKIKQLPTAPVVDVRTPEEFAKGHIPNAVNMDWNGNGFQQQISALDKTAPVLVYCLSGGRSSSAISKMYEWGFKEVYELDGGIMKWRGANLPEINNAPSLTAGMSQEQFEKLLVSDKLVLVDFYADWCGPCKKMKPYFEAISKELGNKVVVVRINADDNQNLTKALQIDALPVVSLYKNKSLVWTHTGYMSKEDMVNKLN
ncbi:MAG: thioredoxin domain-containing protein [Spirosomataceae bacterium]